MSDEDERKGLKVRELVEVSGFKTVAAVTLFLQKIGKGIDDVESIVTNVNTGVSLLLETGKYVIGALTRPAVDAQIDFHRRQLERLEKKKRENL